MQFQTTVYVGLRRLCWNEGCPHTMPRCSFLLVQHMYTHKIMEEHINVVRGIIGDEPTSRILFAPESKGVNYL